MMDRNKLLGCVPVGKANALSIMDIWGRLGMWSHHSVRNWLTKFVAAGTVKMELQTYRRGSSRCVFWRET